MDTIRFVIEDYIDEENRFRFPTINIYINESNLIELVEKIERTPYGEMDEEVFEQSYVGLHPEYHRDFLKEFLGLHDRPSILLTCKCLEVLCNCITAKIFLGAETVMWADIKSPWLSSKTPNGEMTMEQALEVGWLPIDYSTLGNFVFNRGQYLDALDNLK
jgi:hypothetical protein